MFYPKIQSNPYDNAYLLAGSEPPPGRNEASLANRAECKQERKGKNMKRKEKKKNLRGAREGTEDYSEITYLRASRKARGLEWSFDSRIIRE